MSAGTYDEKGRLITWDEHIKRVEACKRDAIEQVCCDALDTLPERERQTVISNIIERFPTW